MLSPTPPVPPQHPSQPLTDCLVALAGTPDDSSWIEPELIGIAQLAGDLLTPGGGASVTEYHGDRYRTVAASSDIAMAADRRQYAADAGPCLDALDTGSPVAVPDIAANTTWLEYREAAAALHIRASLSVPLFAGRGKCLAALNLYSSDHDTIAALTGAALQAYRSHRPRPPAQLEDSLAQALLAGLTGAFAVRALIQEAIAVISADMRRTADSAYLFLRLRAAETGLTLPETAAVVIAERQ
jgi:hypothetical protein